MKLSFLLEFTESGFVASACIAEDLIVTAGKLSEIRMKILEAVQLFNEERGTKYKWEDVHIEADLASTFELLPPISSSGIAEYASMNKSLLSQYKLGIKKPSRKQLAKIENSFHELGDLLTKLKFTS